MISSSSLLDSTASFSRDGFLLEQRHIPPGERPETVTKQHILWLWKTPNPSEYADRTGHFVRCPKAPGVLTQTPVGIIPTVHSRAQSEVVMCALEPQFVERISSEADRHPKVEPTFRPRFWDSAIQRLMTLLMEEALAGAPAGKLYSESLVHAIASRFLWSNGNSYRRNFPSSARALPRTILRRVLELIESSLDVDLSLESLAKESGYSRAYFLKMFRGATGMTPHQYILNRRLDRAQFLLRQPKRIGLIDIAAVCGFCNQSHMTAIFRKHLGVTPTEYRLSK